MTNYQCYCYSAKALSNLISNKVELTPDTFYSQLWYLWDIYTEEEIEKIVSEAERKNELF